MDDNRANGIASGIATGVALIAVAGGLPGSDTLVLSACALAAWVTLAMRRPAVAARVPVLSLVGVEAGRRAGKSATASAGRGHGAGLVFRREDAGRLDGTAGPEGTGKTALPVSTNGAGTHTSPPHAASAPRAAETEELERLATELEDHEEAREEISFLPPYASDEDGDTTEPQRSDAWQPLQETAASGVEEPHAERRKMPAPRHFALGTVAVIRKLLEPEEVDRIMSEQRRYPRLRFGDVAVQLGFLTDTQLQELLLAQQEGLFTEAEIRDARDRLRAYTRQNATSRR